MSCQNRTARTSAGGQKFPGLPNHTFGFFGRVGKRREMPHFSPWASRFFPVEVKFDLWDLENSLPVGLAIAPKVSQEICHGSRSCLDRCAKRHSAHRPNLLLKLARHKSINRQMTRIVWARCNLVDEQLIILGEKKLDADNPNHVQLCNDLASNFNRFWSYLGQCRKGDGRHIQNMLIVLVTDGPIRCDGPIRATSRQNRQLAGKIDEALENCLRRSD